MHARTVEIFELSEIGEIKFYALTAILLNIAGVVLLPPTSLPTFDVVERVSQ